jgi:O-glycosyl hydrolase
MKSMKTKLILMFLAGSLLANMQSYAQTEVMAWGNLTGIRIDGELIEFETSFRIVEKDRAYVFVSGRERAQTAFRREGGKAVVQSGAMWVKYGETVEDAARGKAVVNLTFIPDSTRQVEGVYYCFDLPKKRYANAEINRGGKRITIKTDDRNIRLDFGKPVESFLRKDDVTGNETLYIRLTGGKLVKGRQGELTFTITASGVIDHEPVTVNIDKTNPGRRFTGFGGNFRLQSPNDAKVIDYCLNNMRVAFGRVEIPWAMWQPNETDNPIAAARSGKINQRVEASMMMAKRLAAKGMPVIVSAWFPPQWALIPGQSRGWGGVAALKMDAAKKQQIYRSLADYLVYLKQEYGVEAWAFSFNESDIGIDVLFSAREHADFIKEFGAYLALRGLETKLLLGDNSDATTYDFVEPAVKDKETYPYIAAVSFHSWRGCDDETLRKWAAVSRELNVPLIIGEGSTDAAAWRYPEIFLEETFALYEINLYTRIAAICQPLSILQWQLTADYSPLWGDGIYGSNGELRPTQRFRNLKQFASTPPNLFALPLTSSKEEVNCAAFGSAATGQYAVHIVNNGAARQAVINGIPAGNQLTVYVTDSQSGMKEENATVASDGTITVNLPPVAYITVISEKFNGAGITSVVKNVSPEAKAVLNYLYAMKGKKILSGQMWSPWGIDEIKTVHEITGKYPALKGQDFIHEAANANEIQSAVEWWRQGGIPTVMWHWGAPTKGEGYEQSKMRIDINRCFQEGTEEHRLMWEDLKRIADHLTVLRDAHVPVLWRPMHECDGDWFWYGKGTGEQFVRLWKTMFDYFTDERGLNNLIWVLCHSGNLKASFNPGKAYYDIAGGDSYGGGIQDTLYNEIISIHGNLLPVPFHECGQIPDPDECLTKGTDWSWWMLWHTTHVSRHSKDDMKRIYNHDLIITLDELPDIVKRYGEDTFVTNTSM